jgi:hypothetical protein
MSKVQDGTNRTCTITALSCEVRYDANRKKGFVFKFGLLKPSYFQLALSYNHETRQTHGLLLSKPPDNHIKELIKNLKSNHLSTSQPLLCATIMAEFAIDAYSEQIETCETEVKRLEQVMGQHEWANIPIGNLLELDYIATTRRLNFLVRTFAIESMRLEGALLTLERLAIYTKEITAGDMVSTQCDSGTNKTSQIKTHEGSNEIEEKVAYLQNACQVSVVRAAWHTKRVNALLQVVSSIFHCFSFLEAKRLTVLKGISIHGPQKRQCKYCRSPRYSCRRPGKSGRQCRNEGYCR